MRAQEGGAQPGQDGRQQDQTPQHGVDQVEPAHLSQPSQPEHRDGGDQETDAPGGDQVTVIKLQGHGHRFQQPGNGLLPRSNPIAVTDRHPLSPDLGSQLLNILRDDKGAALEGRPSLTGPQQ